MSSDIAATQWPDKNPSDVVDYTADFTEFLETGETIASKTVVAPAGITKDTDVVSTDGKKVIVWLSSGVDGDTYEFAITIVTDAATARTFKRYWALRVTEKL